MTQIDWFQIDMESFQTLYDEYRQAVCTLADAEAAFAACEHDYCTHDRKLRKDGKPDGRSRCPQWGVSYHEMTKAGNYLHLSHAEFFEAIGLEYSPTAVVRHA